MKPSISRPLLRYKPVLKLSTATNRWGRSGPGSQSAWICKALCSTKSSTWIHRFSSSDTHLPCCTAWKGTRSTCLGVAAAQNAQTSARNTIWSGANLSINGSKLQAWTRQEWSTQLVWWMKGREFMYVAGSIAMAHGPVASSIMKHRRNITLRVVGL